MQDSPIQHRHEHNFGTDELLRGEQRTRWVIGLTFVTMVAEIAAGTIYGSMALLADGWHMGTHAAALGIAVFAYVYARRYANDPRYSFGTGKVSALGGFASAVGLAVVAFLVLVESVVRLTAPVAIHFNEAIAVAVVGLLVNLASAWILHGGQLHHHDHHHDHNQGHPDAEQHHDHNLRGAYLHVMADALTSVLAIIALTLGKFMGWAFLDPLMGVVGALVIARWSISLLRDTSSVLLDAEVAVDRRETIRKLLEAERGDEVVDLHLWRVGPRHLAAIVALVTENPQPPQHYKSLLAQENDLVHLTVEIHRREDI